MMKVANVRRRSISCCVVFFLCVGFCGLAHGQGSQSAIENIASVPETETFVPANDLVVPWESTGCLEPVAFVDPDCHHITEAELINSHRLSIFNSDGSLWYRFSVSAPEPDYFLKNKKPGFEPFDINEGPIRGWVVLRLIGESPNWYKVEINETNRTTKFVYKKDPFWAKVKWGYRLLRSPRILVNSSRTKLHDKPNGVIIESSANIEFPLLVFEKADGDWAYVRGSYYLNQYYGWIRWRDGRDLLVGCVFNRFKIP